MKRIEAYQVGACIIFKNYASGHSRRYDTYIFSAVSGKAKRIGCELTLSHSNKIAMLEQSGRKP